MNFKRSFLIFILLFVVFGIFAIFILGGREDLPMKSWLWDTSFIESEHDVEHLKLFLEDKKVDTLYLQIDTNISYTSYRKFIKELAEVGVGVHALDGSPEWNQTDHDRFIQWLSGYQETTDKTGQFKGVHIDIEPYLAENWEQNPAETILSYQNSIFLMGQSAKELELPLGIDIPFWFDEISFDNQFGSGLLAEWLIQVTDEITIMAYRNQAQGSNGIIEIVKQEIKWADKLGKKVRIAVETIELPEEYTSFYSLGSKEMEKQIRKVQKEYGSRRSYGGIAIHHVISWMELEKAN